jgi:hypothetical protein
VEEYEESHGDLRKEQEMSEAEEGEHSEQESSSDSSSDSDSEESGTESGMDIF